MSRDGSAEKLEPPDGRRQGRKKAEQITHCHGTICALPIPRSFSGCKLFLKTVRFVCGDPCSALDLPLSCRAKPVIPRFLLVSQQ